MDFSFLFLSKTLFTNGLFTETVLTGGLVHALLHRVLLLGHPLAVALEVDLRGGRGLAVEIDWFVFDNVGLLGLHQEVGEGLGRVRRKGLGKLAQSQVVILCWKEREGEKEREIRISFINLIHTLQSNITAHLSLRRMFIQAGLAKRCFGTASTLAPSSCSLHPEPQLPLAL